MNASDVAGRPIEPDEAIKQIAYIRDLLESTKQRVATYWPIFVLWGPLWVIGYTSEHWYDTGGPAWLAWRWAILNGMGGVGTLLWLVKRRQRQPLTSIERQMVGLQVVLFLAFAFGVPLAIGDPAVVVDFDMYVPFYLGVVYLAAGIFLGRQLVFIGAWIAGCAVAAAFLPEDIRWLWFAVNGGGGLLTTGLILRRQLSRA